MKHIIMIKSTESDSFDKIEKALISAGIECKVNANTKTVAVDRNGDIIAAAKRIIVALGYHVI